jgi:hypothetical protein
MGATPWHLAGDQRPIQHIMKQTVSSYQFVDSFSRCGRQTQFSVAARYALFEYLEEYEDSCGVELELDPIAICCEWSEYPSAIAASKEYGQEFSDEMEAFDWLMSETNAVSFTGGVVVQSF